MDNRLLNVNFRKLIGFSMILMFLFKPVFAADEAKVELFSPQGVVKGIRQATARFSEQMAAFGDPGLSDPFDIQCPEKGKGRWVDGKNWIFDFDSDLPAGIQCEFTLKPGLKTLSGKPVKGRQKFMFSTGGPAVTDMNPREYQYLKIKEDQAFVLYLDAETDESSILSNVWFSVEGINQKIGVKIFNGEDKEKILKSIGWTEKNNFRQDRILVVQCRQIFPSHAKVSLTWGKNVKSKTGVSNTEDQIFSYHTREAFSASFSCERENANTGCIPVLPMRLEFSSPVSAQMADAVVMQGSNGVVYHRYKEEKEQTEGDDESKASGYVNEIMFKGPFPENQSFSIRLPENIRDDAGRLPVNRNKFPFTVKTASMPPLAKFSSRFGIIEKNEDAVLPVTLSNLGSGKSEGSIEGRMVAPDMKNRGEIIQWLRKIAGAGRRNSVFSKEVRVKSFTLPKALGAKAFEVVGIPLEKPGLHIVELESRVLGASLLGENRPMYVPTAALVTNLSAHMKRGKDSSLIWVTALDTGKAVENAMVFVTDCNGNDVWTWKTDEKGMVYIPKDLTKSPGNCKIVEDNENYFDSPQLGALWGIVDGYFVFVETSDDATFLHSSWDQGIETWRYQLPEAPYRTRNIIAHTVLDRSLLRAGETVHMKHVIRKHSISGFLEADDSEMPVSIVVQHQGSDQWVAFPLKWDRNGTAETEWKIPKDAKLGSYLTALFLKPPDQLSNDDIGSLADRYGDEDSDYTGFFRVEEFRIPLMKAVIQPPREPLINAAGADIDISLRYLSGGGANHAKVKLRKAIQNRGVEFSEYDRFVFAADEVREGIQKTDEETGEEPSLEKIAATELTLDDTGSIRSATVLPKVAKPQNLITELEFFDPNGEIQTASATIPLWPSRYLI
ncbi:MAG: MG2 domain-containing protein, partial [Desulfobacula sp.]